MTTTGAALRAVERATHARLFAAADAATTQEAQAVAIRAALAAGAPVADIAAASNLTAARIYQIRDGKR